MTERTDYDGTYRRLFGEAVIARDLLERFVEWAMVDELDLERMEREEATFVTPELERRQGDIVWRVARKDGAPLYVYVLLELQSRSARDMAIRCLVYVGLLAQQVLAQRSTYAVAHMPATLSIVLFSGEGSWTAPTSLRELIALPPTSAMWRAQPEMTYIVVDEGVVADSDEELEDTRGIVELLFRMRHAEELEDVRESLQLVDDRTQGGEFTQARREIALWVSTVLEKKTGLEVERDQIDSLLEVRDMLEDRFDEWKERWKKEAIEEGLEEGRAKGLAEGRAEGLAEGLAEALWALLEAKFEGVRASIAQEDVEALDDDALLVFISRAATLTDLDDVRRVLDELMAEQNA